MSPSSSLYLFFPVQSNYKQPLYFHQLLIFCLVQVLLFAFISCASAGRIFILDDGEDGEKLSKIISPRDTYRFQRKILNRCCPPSEARCTSVRSPCPCIRPCSSPPWTKGPRWTRLHFCQNRPSGD